MQKTILGIPFALAIALIIYAERTFNFFTVWNCLPVVTAFFVLTFGLRARGPLLPAGFVFSVLAVALTVLFHLAWLFDWGKTATGSSTSALAFIFVPIWAVLLAVVSAGITWAVASLFQRSRTSKPL